jgi:hypothetical protein
VHVHISLFVHLLAVDALGHHHMYMMYTSCLYTDTSNFSLQVRVTTVAAAEISILIYTRTKE